MEIWLNIVLTLVVLSFSLIVFRRRTDSKPTQIEVYMVFFTAVMIPVYAIFWIWLL